MSSTKINKFINSTPKGTRFNLGDELSGFHEVDGSCWYSSKNEERFIYKNIQDMAEHYFKKECSVLYKYQYYLGERDLETGHIIFIDGIYPEDVELEDNENSNSVWSKLVDMPF